MNRKSPSSSNININNIQTDINMLTQAEIAAATAAAFAAGSAEGRGSTQTFVSDEQRQIALANLFNSLSNFASNTQTQPLTLKSRQQVSSEPSVSLDTNAPDRSSPNQCGPLALTGQMQSAELTSHIGAIQPTSTIVPSHHLTAIGQQQQQQQQQHQQPHPQQQQQQQQQRINYCTICNKELCNKYFMKTHMLKMHGISLEMEQSTSEDPHSGDLPKGRPKDKESDVEQITQDSTNQESSKRTTSVLNGFAGNSMGGVVCDICNKELCSKYFLKVHKQNTHGIVTDQMDAASQSLMYPLAAQLAVAAAAAAASNSSSGLFPSSAPTSSGLLASPMFGHPVNTMTATAAPAPTASSRKAKRAKLCPKTFIGERSQDKLQSETELTAHSHMSMTNPLGALMCLGALGSPTGLSPALVVDNILRNQHLIAGHKSKDKNNNQIGVSVKSEPKTGAASSSGANGSNGARYFSHYTEACPMCDRRFKSIKWLKTHMMNDHKQEIATYMHMMMQYLHYSSRATNQQVASAMAAAAAAAAASQQYTHQNSGGKIQLGFPTHGHRQQQNIFNSTTFGPDLGTSNLLVGQTQPLDCYMSRQFAVSSAQQPPHTSPQSFFDSRYQKHFATSIGKCQQTHRQQQYQQQQQLQQQQQNEQPHQHPQQLKQSESTYCAMPADFVIHGRRESSILAVPERVDAPESPGSDLSISGSELNFSSSILNSGSTYRAPRDLKLNMDLPDTSSSELESETESHDKPTNCGQDPIEIINSSSLSSP